MIKAVIFDFGGVVHTIGEKRISQILSEKTGNDREEYRKKLIPLLLSMSVGRVSEDDFWNEMGGFQDGVWEEQMKDNKLNNEVILLVNELKKKGIKTAVLSNTIPPHTDRIRQLEWYDNFDQVFLSWEIGLRKPDRKAYEYVLKQLNLHGEDCIFIDDLETNLVPAKELGIKTILAKSPDQIVTDINKMLEMKQVAVALITDSTGKIFLQQRDNKPGIVNPGMISFFGGSVEKTETAREALKRELKEELDLEVWEQAEYLDSFYKTKDPDGEDSEIVVYVVKIKPDAVLRLREGKDLLILHPGQNLEGLNLTRITREAIGKYLSHE